MGLVVYDTLSRQKKPFETIEPGVVRMYVCGPTVYDSAHIGHAMSAIVFDVVRRYLEYRGYKVRHVMNFTDVDDKIIARANESGEDPFDIANRYIEDWHRHTRDLNLLPATHYPKVSETIQQIIEIVDGLIRKGYAYEANGSVYFRVRADDDYGKLSRRKLDEVLRGTRVDVQEEKEDPNDFALWKAWRPGEPYWESPWGKGRPGWHIECSAMSLKYLGEQLDIHGGGTDLIFPHHENEIAQSESYTGKVPFVRYWMHNGMLQLGNEKMSKSLGNMITIDEFLERYDADVLRLIILSSHYRTPLLFTWGVAEENKRALERLRGALRPPIGDSTTGEAVDELNRAVIETRERFEAAMDDDFNTAGALGHLFELVTAINRARDAGVGGTPFAEAQATFRELTGVLGLRLESQEGLSGEIGPFVDLLVEVRGELRAAKLWALADRIRDRLRELGIVLEDGPKGTTWRRES